MSTPLPPPGSGSGTSTQEIPVVPAAVANTQHLPPPPSAPSADVPDAMRTTGPVEYVPEPPPTARPARLAAAADRRGPAALALAALALVVLELGLLLSFGGRSFWSAVPLWSAFATVMGVAGLVAVGGQLRGARPAASRVAAGALSGLAVFWLLVVLPVADTDRGFLLTAALGLLGAGAWLSRRTAR